MTQRSGTIQRAYELAREGKTVGEIKQALKSEGYTDGPEQLFGRSLNADLRRLRLEALEAQAAASEIPAANG